MYCEIDRAKDLAGEREKYAMEHGEKKCNFNRQTGELSWTWVYSEDDEYQDANGATYSINRHKWVA